MRMRNFSGRGNGSGPSWVFGVHRNRTAPCRAGRCRSPGSNRDRRPGTPLPGHRLPPVDLDQLDGVGVLDRHYAQHFLYACQFPLHGALLSATCLECPHGDSNADLRVLKTRASTGWAMRAMPPVGIRTHDLLFSDRRCYRAELQRHRTFLVGREGLEPPQRKVAALQAVDLSGDQAGPRKNKSAPGFSGLGPITFLLSL